MLKTSSNMKTFLLKIRDFATELHATILDEPACKGD